VERLKLEQKRERETLKQVFQWERDFRTPKSGIEGKRMVPPIALQQRGVRQSRSAASVGRAARALSSKLINKTQGIKNRNSACGECVASPESRKGLFNGASGGRFDFTRVSVAQAVSATR
jgi:hypothetical protein